MTYTTEQIADHLGRIGRTIDGRALKHLLMVTIQSTISEAAPDGALRAHAARRNYARELLELLDPRPQPSNEQRDDVLLKPAARSVRRDAGAAGRRRVPALDPGDERASNPSGE